eukprot:5881116-Pleurochrysis_carterae.AAC.1
MRASRRGYLRLGAHAHSRMCNCARTLRQCCSYTTPHIHPRPGDARQVLKREVSLKHADATSPSPHRLGEVMSFHLACRSARCKLCPVGLMRGKHTRQARSSSIPGTATLCGRAPENAVECLLSCLFSRSPPLTPCRFQIPAS